jgi:D-alanyl-lipoteichoic acid acyltransferase DltB (MBOAT superfamily)
MDRVLRSPLFAFVFTALQFALVYLLMVRYHIETEPFRNVVALCLGAFLVNFWLPMRYRMAWFMAVSAASIALVFGMDKGSWSIALAGERAGWLIGIVGLIVGICALPINYWARFAMVAAVMGLLIAFRSAEVSSPVPAAIWPILGSMLMFRLIVYLYDLKHAGKPAVTSSFAYFLMAPNVCFPLFPVVDFKAFTRSQEEGATFTSYQIGLLWIVRGVIQLLLYRAVYYEAYLDPSHVADGADVAQFLLVNYLLYLRVSGQFHVIVGLLRMFGFALPETHHRYYLATSFTDYWRRINIYWKDFIMKIFYYPIMFRLKKMPKTQALVIATLIAFFATWFLHAYQWFWLRGSFPLPLRDIAFWGVLAALVTVNSVWEAKKGRKRTLGAKKVNPREVVVNGLKAAGTFLVICVLWSVWTSRSMDEWFDVVGQADGTTLLYMAGALAVIFFAAVIPAPRWLSGADGRSPAIAKTASLPILRQAVMACTVPVVVLIALSTGAIHSRLGPSGASMYKLVSAETKPTEGDLEVMERGYYEELIDVGLVNSPLSEVFMKRPADWKRLEQTPALRLSNDYRYRELTPSASNTVNGVVYRANSHGMRDDECAEAKAEGVVRIAFLGASIPMGWGVEEDDTFVSVLEDRLNAGGQRFEVLNFAVNGYSPVCQTVLMEKVVSRFDPDIVVFVSHEGDDRWSINRMARAIREGADLPDPFLDQVARECDVSKKTSLAAAERRLGKRSGDLVSWAYKRMAQQARDLGALPVWVYVPGIKESAKSDVRYEQFRGYAADAGFETLDLRGVYGSANAASLAIAPWDYHPNADGHRLVAERLHQAITSHPKISPLVTPK